MNWSKHSVNERMTPSFFCSPLLFFFFLFAAFHLLLDLLQSASSSTLSAWKGANWTTRWKRKVTLILQYKPLSSIRYALSSLFFFFLFCASLSFDISTTECEKVTVNLVHQERYLKMLFLKRMTCKLKHQSCHTRRRGALIFKSVMTAMKMNRTINVKHIQRKKSIK